MGEISGFILAGGKSTRMGRDKAFLEFEGANLLDRAMRTASAVAAKVFIVGDPDKFPPCPSVIADEYRDRGPLAGIHAALRRSATELNLILAVDLPFVSPDFLQFLVKRAEAAQALVTLAEADGRLQPLCAIYRQTFAEVAEGALRRGQNRIDRLFTREITQRIAESEWSSQGFPRKLFHNLNSPSDMAIAETLERGR